MGSKKIDDEFKQIQTHLKVLGERTNRLKSIIRKRKKLKYYNNTELKRVLKKIKGAKRNIADAEFI
jgi:hypothetical protein